MRRKSFKSVPCGIARASDILSDAWNLVILREALFGTTAFEDFVSALAIPRTTLSAKLDALVEHGLMSRRQDQADMRRTVYELEESGRELWVLLAALQQWGNKWCFADGKAPSTMVERKTGEPIQKVQILSAAGDSLSLSDVEIRPEPTAPPELVAKLRGASTAKQ